MQGFNMGRYVPPDVEGTTTGNRLHGKHALGARASKLASRGILTVRFEMPFAVWCSTCARPTLVGQGVRFNAEKRRVGSYHTSPVFAFRMRHADCGGTIEIRTDPAASDYVVVEGGRRKVEAVGADREGDSLVGDKAGIGGGGGNGGMNPILTDAERETLRTNAFAKLERTIEDRALLQRSRARIDELADAARERWEDPYAQNRRLRDAFRVGRKERERDALAGEGLKDRMSLDIDLVPATEEDGLRTSLVDFGPTLSQREEDELGEGRSALEKPLFPGDRKNDGLVGRNDDDKMKMSKHTGTAAKVTQKEARDKKKKRLKSEIAASQTRENLVSEIVGNTRVSQDPFLVAEKQLEGLKSTVRITGIKRKKEKLRESVDMEEIEGVNAEVDSVDNVDMTTGSAGLVEYDSD